MSSANTRDRQPWSCDDKQALNLYVEFLRDKYTKARFGCRQNATRQTIISYFATISSISMMISGESFIVVDRLQQKILRINTNIFRYVQNIASDG